MRIFQLLLPAALLAAPLLAATEPAAPAAPAASVQFHDDPVDTSSPRATMRSFYTAMQDYKKGLDTGDEKLKERINDAIRCFDLSQLPAVGRRLAATQAAIYLKEIIDRSTVIDYGKLPDSPVNWKSRTGTFVIRQKQGGDQDSEYLITAESLSHLPETFELLKSHPYVKGGGGGAGYQPPWIERHLPPWALNRMLGAACWQWLGLAAILLCGLAFRGLTRRLFGWCLHLSKHTSMKWDKVLIAELTAPLALLAATLFWAAAIHGLALGNETLRHFLGFGLLVLGCGALIWTLYRLTHVLHLYLVDYAKRPDNNLDEQLVNLITRTLKIGVLLIGVLMVLQNLGVQVSSVLAGLGIGGLAVALAAKDMLANFFGSVMIMVDRPFRVGHYIKVNGQEGTVEEIGFRSTKIRTPYGSLVSIPSAELSLAAIDNLGLRRFRRIRAVLGVTYGTTPEQLTAFTGGIRQLLDANPNCRKDYLVAFSEFNSSSLDVLVNFFVDVPDLAAETAEKEKIFLAIMQLAERLGVGFAFPSQSLYIEKLPETKALN